MRQYSYESVCHAEPQYSYQYILWNFGDGSSLQTTNDSVSHTYASGNYILEVSVINEHGCTIRYNQDNTIDSHSDNLSQGFITEDPMCPVCPIISNKTLVFLDNGNTTPHSATYQWRYPLGHLVEYHVNHTDDYYVYVYDTQYHCRVEANRNVAFLNAPTANISTSSEVFCANEK